MCLANQWIDCISNIASSYCVSIPQYCAHEFSAFLALPSNASNAAMVIFSCLEMSRSSREVKQRCCRLNSSSLNNMSFSSRSFCSFVISSTRFMSLSLLRRLSVKASVGQTAIFPVRKSLKPATGKCIGEEKGQYLALNVTRIYKKPSSRIARLLHSLSARVLISDRPRPLRVAACRKYSSRCAAFRTPSVAAASALCHFSCMSKRSLVSASRCLLNRSSCCNK